MEGSKSVREVFAGYTAAVDDSLHQLFSQLPKYTMYQHLAYFMGFADEELKPATIYGGKRFRSALCLMLSDFYGHKEAAVPTATAIELFHNFTLIHDDIVDGDTLRRGRPTVWKLFGTDHAINSGDAQALLAYQTVAQGNALPLEQLVAVQSCLGEQFLAVIEGQYLDFTLTDAALTDEIVNAEAYFEMIERKTAALIVAATKGAGLVANVSEADLEALVTYGHQLGVAYQICDDTVSIWADQDETGKRAYGDLLEQKKTLPILYAHERLAAEDKAKLEAYFAQSEPLTDADAEAILSLLDSVGTYEAMREEIERTAGAAKAAAQKLSLTDEQRATLVAVVDALLPQVK